MNREINYAKFNIDMVEFANDNKIQSPTDYLVTTSLKNKYTYILKKNPPGYKDMWDLMYKWQCSIGKPSTPTITGTFNIIGRKPSFGDGKNYSAKYATIIVGLYYYHSVLYDSTGSYVIDDRLGVAISHGCIRLATENAKWIYLNIPNNTKVIIK